MSIDKKRLKFVFWPFEAKRSDFSDNFIKLTCEIVTVIFYLTFNFLWNLCRGKSFFLSYKKLAQPK